MNNERRRKLRDLIALIEQVKSVLEDIRGDEQDYLDAMPEAFQQADKGEAATAAIDAMETAGDTLETAVDLLEEASQ